RKQHGEAVDTAQDLPHAPTTPRPDLRAHVVEDRYPASLGDPGERQVEFREVDQHEQLRRPLVELAAQHPIGPQERTPLLPDLDEPECGDLGDVDGGVHTARPYFAPAHTPDLHARLPAA